MIRVLFYFLMLCFYMVSSGEQNLIKLDVIKKTVFLESTLDLEIQNDMLNYGGDGVAKIKIYHQLLKSGNIINNSSGLIIFQFGFAYDDWRNYINLLSGILLCAIFMLLLSVILI